MPTLLPLRPRRSAAPFVAALLGVLVTVAGGRAAPQPVDEADPMIGTGGHGHTYPGATVPFGFVQVSPDTRTQGWDACSGYHYSDSTILGFSHTHLSGTGAADLGQLLLMPVTGALLDARQPGALASEHYKSAFSHDHEFARPGYYRVRLDRYGITAELTATAHAAMHRYTFPAGAAAHVLVDLVHSIGNKPVDAELRIENARVVSGYRHSNGWSHNKTLYFVIESSVPIAGSGLEVDDKPLPAGAKLAHGTRVRGHLDFQLGASRQVVLRIGLSPTSIDEARANLAAEIPGWDFDAVHAAATKAWNDNLGRLRIESSNPLFRRTFYSALYHTMLAPTLYNNADGSYRGADGAVHRDGFQYYSTFSLWDTYRAEHPLLTLVEAERVNDFVRSLLAFYQQSPEHQLPMWPLASYDTHCMIAYHAVPVIYDAYEKGFRGFDAQLAYQAMVATATSSRNRQDEYQKFGYVIARTGQRNQAASRTLEFSYDDWCIAQMARALGHRAGAARFSARAQSYAKLFDPQTGFFRARTADGSFHQPFDPRAVSFEDYTEANAWQYGFAVQQDVPGMIKLYGGNAAFIRKLDAMFDAVSDIPHYLIDVSGLIGQYSHGNEPCHHIAYLYSLAGAPYKTAQRVRQIMLTQYEASPEGLAGNDDCGQMSAWYVWSALGLYPVNPASGVYVIGSPMVEKATLALDPRYYPGGTFTIIAHDASRQNAYVQWAKLNGRPLTHPWITQADIAHGGTLEFQMGILPNRGWGATP